MKTLARIIAVSCLLTLSGCSTRSQAQDVVVQGASLTQISGTNIQQNFFVFLISTNTPPANGSNYIAQLSSILSALGVPNLSSNNTFSGTSNFFQNINFPLLSFIAYTPSNNVFTGSNTFAGTTFFQFMQLSQLLTTNIDFAEMPWPGPTNVIDFTTNRLTYTATTSVAISGFANQGYSVLEVTNGAGSNITFALPHGVSLPIGDSNPYVVTNGDVLVCSLEHKKNGTNSVTRVFHYQ